MRLSKRDKAIINDLARFRCLSRDDIAEMHFGTLKDPVKAANTALLRLYRQGLIKRTERYDPFVYFPAANPMKKDSQKIPHFLAIAAVYRELCTFEQPDLFTVEPKYQKGLAEPDVFTIFKQSPLFIEVQRTTYTQAQMDEKMARYEALYASGLIGQEPWQVKGKPAVFPALLMITQTRYAIKSAHFPIMQAASVADFMRQMRVNVDDKPAASQPRIIINTNRGA